MATLLDLANEMDALAARIAAASKQVSEDVALTVLNDLLQTTPVDVGTALSNWQLTLDAPAVGVVPAFAPSPKGRVVKGEWTHKADPVLTAQANVPLALDAAKLVLAGRQPGQLIFITNNMPYIQKLNDGDSTQAPAGFVDRAILLGGQVVARVKI